MSWLTPVQVARLAIQWYDANKANPIGTIHHTADQYRYTPEQIQQAFDELKKLRPSLAIEPPPPPAEPAPPAAKKTKAKRKTKAKDHDAPPDLMLWGKHPAHGPQWLMLMLNPSLKKIDEYKHCGWDARLIPNGHSPSDYGMRPDAEPTPAPAPVADPPAAEEPEPFTLTNPPPKPTFWKCPKQPKATQHVLFAGLDCLAGQNDLFATDGSAE